MLGGSAMERAEWMCQTDFCDNVKLTEGQEQSRATDSASRMLAAWGEEPYDGRARGRSKTSTSPHSGL